MSLEKAPVLFTLAETLHHFDQGRKLFREYASTLGFGLEYQDFEAELAAVEKKYGPPEGRLVLCQLKDSGEAIGCVAVRKLTPETAELKRLYIQPPFRALKLGKQLLERALEQAIGLGYKRVRLDTVADMHAAIGLYQRHGFYEIPPYYPTPIPNTVFMEKEL